MQATSSVWAHWIGKSVIELTVMSRWCCLLQSSAPDDDGGWWGREMVAMATSPPPQPSRTVAVQCQCSARPLWWHDECAFPPAMDYQCIIVYTIITILPNRPLPAAPPRDSQRGCLAFVKRWIKRSAVTALLAKSPAPLALTHRVCVRLASFLPHRCLRCLLSFCSI